MGTRSVSGFSDHTGTFRRTLPCASAAAQRARDHETPLVLQARGVRLDNVQGFDPMTLFHEHSTLSQENQGRETSGVRTRRRKRPRRVACRSTLQTVFGPGEMSGDHAGRHLWVSLGKREGGRPPLLTWLESRCFCGHRKAGGLWQRLCPG